MAARRMILGNGVRIPNGGAWTAGAVFLVILLVAPAAIAPAGGLNPLGPTAMAHGGPGTTSPSPYVCALNLSPDAPDRNVHLAAPSFSLAAGDSITSSYEFEVVNTTLSPLDVQLTLPSFFAKFPLSTGSDLSAYLPPRSITLTNLQWSNASLATKTVTMTSAATFSGSPAFMTTELLAIMANASYQSVTLAFRWHWSITFATNGTTVTSAWSRVATSGPSPTTFYPAPYVQLVSKANTTVDVGSDFSVTLSGAVSDTAFHSVLENASTGQVIQNDPTDTPVGSTSVVAAVQVLPYDAALGPGALLDHVRNVCGALLYSVSLRAVYAASSAVALSAQPSSCGPVQFNGTWYSSGTKVSLRPSSTPISISVAACSGKTFSHWGRTNGVWVSSPSSMSTTATVSANGTLTATFG